MKKMTKLEKQTPSLSHSKTLLCLANAMNSINCLEFFGRIEDWFHQKHMRGLDQIQSLWAVHQRQQQASDIQVVSL